MKARGYALSRVRLSLPRLVRGPVLLLLVCAACALLTGSVLAQQASTTSLPSFQIDPTLPGDIILNHEQGLGQCHWPDPAILSHPYIGWAYDSSPEFSAWSVIEPQPGVFNWSGLDNKVRVASSRGKRIWLQVMASDGMIPQWAIDAGVPIVPSHGGMPVPWNPTYLQLLRRVVHAMAERYDDNPAVEAIVIAAGGCYGEMTICDASSAGDAWRAAGYTDTVFVQGLKATIDLYLEQDYVWGDGSHTHGFLNTPVVLQLGTGLYGMGTAREPVVGYAMDTYGMRVWLKFNGLGADGTVSTIYANYDTVTRVGYEPAGSMAFVNNPQYYVMQTLNEHSSYLCLQDTYFNMVGSNWDQARDLAARYLGSQIVFRSIEAPASVMPGQDYAFATEWVNRGTTPLMYPRRGGIKDFPASYDIEIAFVSYATGNTVFAYTFTPSVPTTNWYSAQPVRIEEYIWIPGTLPAGDYSVRVALVRPDVPAADERHYFALVNTDLADGDGRYSVAGITVLADNTTVTPGAPTRTPTPTRTRTLTPTFTRTQTPTLTRTLTPTLTPTPFGMPTRAPELRMEAEAGAIEEPMVMASDPNALGGYYVYTPLVAGNYGHVTLSFWVAVEGNYEIWARAWGDGWGSDSFWLSVDGGEEILWDLPLGEWRWVPVTDRDDTGLSIVQFYHLGIGLHTVRVRTREAGAKLDVMELNPLSGTPTPLPTATPTPTDVVAATVTPTPPGMPTATPGVWREAESGVLSSPMTIGYDVYASGGQYVYSPYGASGLVTLTLAVYTTGDYEVWGRVQAESYGSDSFWVTVDGGAEAEWHIPLGEWEWKPVTHPDSFGVFQTQHYALGPGMHIVMVRTREAGTKLDAVEFRRAGGLPIYTPTAPGPTATGTRMTGTPTRTPTQTPTLSGAPTATPGPFPEEAENGVLQAPMVIGYDATASGGRYVYVPRDYGISVSGAVTMTFWITASGNYELQGRVSADDYGADSFWVTVDGGDLALWDLPIGDWAWRPVSHRDPTTGEGITLGYYFAAGAHKVVIRSREAGAKLDVMEARGLKHGTPPAPTLSPTPTNFGALTATPTSTVPSTQTPTVTRTATATLPQTPTRTLTPTLTRTSTPMSTVTRTPTATPPPAETTITLQHGTAGYSGCEDTQIDFYAPTTSYCNLDLLKVGERQHFAMLLRFDVSSIPADAIVTQAFLQLYAAGWGGEDMAIDAFRVIRPVTMCQATWIQAQTGMPWAVPGCNDSTDRAPAALSTVTTDGISQWYSWNVTAAAQGWVDGSYSNHGVVLQGAYPPEQTGYYFASAQNALVANRPKLVITYRLPAGPTRTPTATALPTGTPTRTPTGSASQTPSRTPTRTLTPVSTATSPITEGTITLQQGNAGYTGSADTHIYAYEPTSNFSAEGSIRVGLRQYYVSLLRFDISAVPANAVVQRATLELYAVGWGGANMTIDAYRVLRNMDPAQATWNQAANGSTWGTPGGNNTTTDRAALPEASATTDSLFEWSVFDLTSLVQSWLDGSLANNGVMLRGQVPAASDVYYFASAQNSNSQFRPRLVISYRVSGTPAPTRTSTATPTPTLSVAPSPTLSPTRTTPGTETSVTLQMGSNGYYGCEDTEIYIYEPTQNYCSSDLIKVGERRRYVGLVRFDVSSVPANAFVLQATLRLYAYGWSGASLPISVFRVIRPVALCQATWIQAQTGNPWGVAGCENTTTDRSAAALSSITTTGIGDWHAFDITSAVQGWVQGSQANNGVVLQEGWPAVLDSIYFASAQNPNLSLRPQLVIRYRVP